MKLIMFQTCCSANNCLKQAIMGTMTMCGGSYIIGYSVINNNFYWKELPS